MKNRYCIIHPAFCFFFFSLIVVLLSWIGEIYNWEKVQNLLSAEGIRWWLRNAGPSFFSAPYLDTLFFLCVGIGTLSYSGWIKATFVMLCRRNMLSRREKNAWITSMLVWGAGVLAGSILIWGPWNGVRSITGGFVHSPLWEGSALLIAAECCITGLVYGFSVDSLHTDRDVVKAMSCGISYCAEAFVSLFFLIQFFLLLQYSNLPFCWHIPPETIHVLYIFSILLTFGLVVEKKFLSL